MNIKGFIVITLTLSFLTNCLTIPKPVQITEQMGASERKELYDNEKITKGNFFTNHRYKNDSVVDLSLIMAAEYASDKTKTLWTDRNIWYYISMVPAFVGGYMIGYGFSTGNNTLGLAGIGTAFVSFGLGGLSYSYELDAIDSYNKDLGTYLQVSWQQRKSNVHHLAYTRSF